MRIPQQQLDAKATYAHQIMFLYRDEKQKPSEIEEYEQLRNIISSNLQQLVCFYQQIKDERERLYQAEYELEGKVFSAFFEIEMFFELVEGYANAISQYGYVKQRDNAIKELEHGNIFNNKAFIKWLSTQAASEYPNLLTYVALVNYFRIQIIKYLKPKP
jgi:predicted S18 family serine protease